MEESGKEKNKLSETSKPSPEKDEVEIDNSKNYYHYSLNFKKEINLDPSQKKNDMGYIISTALGRNKLYGALFLTNLKFNDPRTAQQYLALTYTPRFRYIVETDDAFHIRDNNTQPVSFRTCPAFGKHGGAGEWVVLPQAEDMKIPIITDDFYPHGGATDRWYMGAWDRELLDDILAKSLRVFSGMKIRSGTLADSFTSDGLELEEEDRDLLFDVGEEIFNKEGYIIATKNGIIIYKKIDEKKFTGATATYLLLLYISVSAGYQPLKNSHGIYVKFWGNMWTDIFKFEDDPTGFLDRIEPLPCNSIMKWIVEPFILYNGDKISGVRVINKNIIMGDYFVVNDLIKFPRLIRSRAEELKRLLTIYPYRLTDKCLYWGNVNYTSIIYLPTLDEESLF